MGANKQSFVSKLGKREVKTIPCPELGEDIHIRMLTSRERADYEAKIARYVEDKNPQVREYVAATMLCDSEGVRLFEESEMGDLGDLDWRILERVLYEGASFNTLDTKGFAAAKEG